MSFRYTKVYVEPPPQKFYGFKKVNPEELLEIVNRIQRPTVTTSTQFDVWKNPFKRDCATPMPKQPRPPSGRCRRDPEVRPSTAPAATSDHSRPQYDEYMIDRLVRRLQKPTISKLVANGKATVEYGDEIEMYQERMRQRRPKSSVEQSKTTERVKRPTTSSKRRVALNNGDTEREVLKTKYSGEYRGQERFLSKDEEQEVLSRVTVKTNAFSGGQPHCPKIGYSEDALTLQQRKEYGLPLISGLPRSSNVDEITARVYTKPNEPGSFSGTRASAQRPPTSRHRSRRVPTATPITVF